MKVIRFYEKRWLFFIISSLLLLAGFVALALNGVQLDIQFKGGAIVQYACVGGIDAARASDAATRALGQPADAQMTRGLLGGGQKLVLSLSGNASLNDADRQKLDAALAAEFPDAGLSLAETSVVEPFFGRKFMQNGMLAIGLAAALIVLYVWYSFRKISGLSAGVTALAALLHDLLMVFFTCVAFRIPIGESFVAVALTVIGYSINDTIVIFDRVRENAQAAGKLTAGELVNMSVTQSLGRSVCTNLCVFISVLMIYAFALGGGIDSIQRFALPMVVGTVSGCYSTVCIAAPLWAMWRMRERKAKRKLSAAQA